MYPSAARRTAARRRARLPQSGRLRHATFVSLLVGYKKVCEGGRRTARVEGVVVVQRTAFVQHAHLVHRHLSHVGDERLEIEDSEAAVQIRIHQCAATHLAAWRDGRARGACECAIGCGLKVDCEVERAYMITCGIVDQKDAKLVQAASESWPVQFTVEMKLVLVQSVSQSVISRSRPALTPPPSKTFS